MKRNMKQKRRARAVVYYLSIVISLALIWGGGMALLRGEITEGVIAILLGILLQLGLKRYGIGDQTSDLQSDEHAFSADDYVRDVDLDRAEPVFDPGDDAPERVPQRPSQRRPTRGTDGATLLLDSGSSLDLAPKYEKGRPDES